MSKERVPGTGASSSPSPSLPVRKGSVFKAGVWITLWLTFHVALAWPEALARESTAAVEVIHSYASYAAGASYPLLFRIRIQPPWLLHGPGDTEEGLIPTVFSVEGAEGLRIKEIRFPDPEKRKFDYTGKPIEVYSGEVLVRAELSIDPTARQGQRHLEGRLSYQACSAQVCRPPEAVPFRIEMIVAPVGSAAERIHTALFEDAGIRDAVSKGGTRWRTTPGLLLTLLGIFLGGLALNLTPCVYPLIPITVSYFGGRARGSGGLRILHGVLYMAGLAMTNSLLGLTAALSGNVLGAALQNPLVLVGVSGILFAMGLNFFGLWELRLPSGLTRMASKNLGGALGSLFMGLTLGIVAAPCVGPFIIGLLTYVGQRGEPILGFLYFFVLSLGLGLPLGVLAVFSEQADRLPLSGEWMVWVRKGLGWILVGMAAYVLWPLMPGRLWRVGILSAVMVVAGLHLGWVDRATARSPIFVFMRKAVGVAALGGAILFFSLSLGEREGVQWARYEEEILVQAGTEGKPVLLDFYADWCPPCRAMDEDVFVDRDVLALSKRLVAVRVDLTTRHPSQEGLQRRYAVKGVPTIVFINRRGIEERDLRIESYVRKDVMADRMQRLLNGP